MSGVCLCREREGGGREGGEEEEKQRGGEHELVIIEHRQHHQGAGVLHYYKDRHTCTHGVSLFGSDPILP